MKMNVPRRQNIGRQNSRSQASRGKLQIDVLTYSRLHRKKTFDGSRFSAEGTLFLYRRKPAAGNSENEQQQEHRYEQSEFPRTQKVITYTQLGTFDVQSGLTDSELAENRPRDLPGSPSQPLPYMVRLTAPHSAQKHLNRLREKCSVFCDYQGMQQSQEEVNRQTKLYVRGQHCLQRTNANTVCKQRTLN